MGLGVFGGFGFFGGFCSRVFGILAFWDLGFILVLGFRVCLGE